VIRLLSDNGGWLTPVALYLRSQYAQALARDAQALEKVPASEGVDGLVLRAGQPLLIPVVDSAPVRFLAESED
jgi:hypothetical protein